VKWLAACCEAIQRMAAQLQRVREQRTSRQHGVALIRRLRTIENVGAVHRRPPSHLSEGTCYRGELRDCVAHRRFRSRH
jgi:hypothetical protein